MYNKKEIHNINDDIHVLQFNNPIPFPNYKEGFQTCGQIMRKITKKSSYFWV